MATQERFDTLLQKCVRTTPEDLSPTRLSSRGNPYSSERSHESQDAVFLRQSGRRRLRLLNLHRRTVGPKTRRH
ncbi:hypothetical protein PPTG_19624 [Phytophthora nicotianae INRA-310]|uniref:Uncharacterized protein n=1 Tax=Phytophthora nicotianae (strain INRA-310) TaxID=761204 RepID=W2PCG7_PHYN3|nr:hypothetical protein PPTG_19624 [Phytophthora nicotianae INRA-310]ETM98330.1 hypothetical protein PPTG_19624 [Phytophthora nicotianae INRA-310]